MENTLKKYSMQGAMLIVQPVMPLYERKGKLGGRGNVKEFSRSSGARMRRYLRCCVAVYTHMVTLTYPHAYPRDGAYSKEHLRKFIQELSRMAARSRDKSVGTKQRWSCFWFMEFQKRGAIHYHLFTTCGYPTTTISELWYRIVGSEDVRHLHAGTRIERLRSGRRGTCSYASKYAAKTEQKTVPDDLRNCGRFWGVSGYRIAVAADVTLTLDDLGCQAITRARERVKSAIKTYMEKGECTQKQFKESVVYCISTDRAQSDISCLMLRLEMVSILYGARMPIIMPHHEKEEIPAIHAGHLSCIPEPDHYEVTECL